MRVLAQEKKAILLDKKDWRILRELVHNTRQPLSVVAKSTQLSRQSVEYRFQQMEKNNLLIGSRTVVNIRALGYSSYHVFVEVRTPEQEKELIQRALKAPVVNALLVYSGKFNLEISLMVRSNEEFLESYHRLVEGLALRDEHILVLQQNLCNEVLPQRYFPLEEGKRKEERGVVVKKSKGKAYLPDELDIELLFLLSRDARRTNNDLARELQLSKDTIKYRIKKLEEQKILVQYRPVVNYATLGLTVNTLLVKLNYTAKAAAAFETLLRATDTVLWATRTFGYYEYIVYVLTKNVEEFHEVINQMKQQFADSIKTYEVLSAFEELKYFFMTEGMVKGEKEVRPRDK